MIQYTLECIAFQLVFLVIYDLFLKRETFFQWNRLYLIGTYVLSLVLPWIKIEALKTAVPEQYQMTPVFLWQMDEMTVSPDTSTSFLTDMSWYVILLCGGMLLALVFFAYKLYKIQGLRNRGDIRHFQKYTRIVVANSSLAFSFFKSIFLGDKVLQKEHDSIIRHELVHIQQRHSYDLLFFELMRICCWFNPLVYIYQSRISELHEFIADAQMAKTDKRESYQALLSEVFQTQHISFINQFFKSSLIKKRIVMLQKSKSKQIWKLKYLAIAPILLGMLIYTSCETEDKPVKEVVSEDIDVPFAVIDEVPIFPGCEDAEDQRECFNKMIQKHISKNFRYPEEAVEKVIQGRVSTMFTIAKDGSITNIRQRGPDKSLEDEAHRIIAKLPKMTPGIQKGKAVRVPFSIPITFKLRGAEYETANKTGQGNEVDGVDVPFAVIEEVPVFPGCENASDKRACFNQMLQKHISKNFRYPEEAQEKGIQGRVAIMFVIGEDGNIGDIRLRGPDKLLEDEAERIIAKLPRMTPGKQKGQAVQVPFSIPITFKLQGEGSSSQNLKFREDMLYIVDGIASSKAQVDALKPENIASVSVLKDKAAIEKYGQVGKNGVIIIKTKGKETAEIHSEEKAGKRMQVAGHIKDEGRSVLYGSVSDGSRGLPGVNITLQGISKGAVSDFDGNFAIEAEKGDVIAFQYTGLPTAMLTVTDQNNYLVEAIQ